MRRFRFLPVFAVATFAISLVSIRWASGSQSPDPNDPDQLDIMDAQVLATNLKAASEVVNERVGRGEISDAKGQEMLSEYADQMIARLDIKQINMKDAWRYADIYRTGRKWDLAAKAYEIALRKPATEDRRINDTLRYAQCLARLGEVKTALAEARKTYDAKPEDSAPVLPAMLLEIAPAAKGKGHDEELANMLLEACEIHAKTDVNPKTTEGILFRQARPFHIRDACKLAAALFTKPEDKERAAEVSAKLAPRRI